MNSKKPRLLQWKRTELASKPRDDYEGRDPMRPRFFARIYLNKRIKTNKPWYWTCSEHFLIAQGEEAELEKAVEQAEAAYARHIIRVGHTP